VDSMCHELSEFIWFDSGPAMIYLAVDVIWIFLAGGWTGWEGTGSKIMERPLEPLMEPPLEPLMEPSLEPLQAFIGAPPLEGLMEPPLEGQRFCGVEDPPRGEWVPIVPFQIQKMSDAMYIEDKEEGMAQFLEVIAHLGLPKSPDSDYPETVSKHSVNEHGSVIQDAVRGGKTDFLRLLLQNGVNPNVGTDRVKETPIELAAKKESTETRTELLTLFAEFVELPAEIKI